MAQQSVMILDTADAGGCMAARQYRQPHCAFWEKVPENATPQS
jgi:hypothetical protein